MINPIVSYLYFQLYIIKRMISKTLVNVLEIPLIFFKAYLYADVCLVLLWSIEMKPIPLAGTKPILIPIKEIGWCEAGENFSS